MSFYPVYLYGVDKDNFLSLYCEGRLVLGSVCSQTQLCHIGVFNEYIKQLHVSAFSGHLQVVLREQT